MRKRRREGEQEGESRVESKEISPQIIHRQITIITIGYKAKNRFVIFLESNSFVKKKPCAKITDNQMDTYARTWVNNYTAIPPGPAFVLTTNDTVYVSKIL